MIDRLSEHGVAPTCGNVSEGVAEKGFADADRVDDGDVGVRLQKSQGGELVEQRLIIRDFGRGIPVFQLHARIELGLARPGIGRRTVAAGDLVTEHQQQQILVRHLLLARQAQAIGEGILDTTEFEPAQDGDQVGRNRVARAHERTPQSQGPRRSGSWRVAPGAAAPSAYWRGSRR